MCIMCVTGEFFERFFGVLTHLLHNMYNLILSYGVVEVTMAENGNVLDTLFSKQLVFFCYYSL